MQNRMMNILSVQRVYRSFYLCLLSIYHNTVAPTANIANSIQYESIIFALLLISGGRGDEAPVLMGFRPSRQRH